MAFIIIYLSGFFITFFYILYFLIKETQQLTVIDLIMTIITSFLSYLGLLIFLIVMNDINIFGIVIYRNKNKE